LSQGNDFVNIYYEKLKSIWEWFRQYLLWKTEIDLGWVSIALSYARMLLWIDKGLG
jgi:hypothetical protein